MAFHYINGEAIPTPQRGASVVVTTVVDSGRNLKAQVVGQRIGRDQYKMDSIVFPFLTAAEWKRVLQLTKGFFFNYTFYDPVTGNKKTIKAYCGDRTAEPYWLDENGKPTHYKDCKVNFIDTGK
jgi:hypothetical protein